MRHLLFYQRLRNDSDHLAPRLQRGIRQLPHQPDLSSAVNDRDPFLHKVSRQ